MLKLAKDWKVQGGIVYRRKFCDPQELDVLALRQALDGHRGPQPVPGTGRRRPPKPV